MSRPKDMELLYQLIPAIQKLDTTRFILKKETCFTEEELEKVRDVISLVRQKADELMKNSSEQKEGTA